MTTTKPDASPEPKSTGPSLPAGQARSTDLVPIAYATGKRTQAHAPDANKLQGLRRLVKEDLYALLLGAILCLLLVLGIWLTWVLHDIRRDVGAIGSPVFAPACVQARAQVMASAQAAKATEGPGAHRQHEAIEETLIQQAQTMRQLCSAP